ncbi:MAG: helix-turn-helix domain-containing protein [Achromobacter mucicolens]
MSSVALKLLDRYAAACGLTKDKDIAARLRVTQASVSGWRHGKSKPDAGSIGRMCDATGESLAHWLPLIEAERARDAESRRVWLRLAQTAAAVAFVVSFGRLDVHHAYSAGALFVAHSPSTLSIMSNGVCLILAVAALLARPRKERARHEIALAV